MSSSSPPPCDWSGDLQDRLKPFLSHHEAPGNGPFQAISLAGVEKLCSSLDLSAREAMAACLERGIWPLRFKNNRGWLGAEEQALLLRSRVAVIGCGGLGGHVLELLARMGIGEFSICDHDIFEESNLNRQRFCAEDRLGMNKALAARDALARLASHAQVWAATGPADAATLPSLLRGAHAAVDCLDSIEARETLEQAAHAAGIPFIHGTIAGLEGFALCSRPEKGRAIPSLYGSGAARQDCAEYARGVPTPTPAAVAVLQALLTVQALLGREPAKLCHLDLSVPELELLDWLA